MPESDSRDSDSDFNPNSALYWLDAAEEAVEYADVETPETRLVAFDFMDSLPLLDGDVPESFPVGELDRAACDLGWPVFIRTDLTSAKHSGASAVRARDADDVMPIAKTLVEDSAMKTMQPASFLVREWIDIEHEFTAFDGLPIGTELRVFAAADTVLCEHYYWPADAIEQPDHAEWSDLRDTHASVSAPTGVRHVAQKAASRASRHPRLDPLEVWSVDFARDDSGTWWLIDMALAANSWHPDCEYRGAPGGNR